LKKNHGGVAANADFLSLHQQQAGRRRHHGRGRARMENLSYGCIPENSQHQYWVWLHLERLLFLFSSWKYDIPSRLLKVMPISGLHQWRYGMATRHRPVTAPPSILGDPPLAPTVSRVQIIHLVQPQRLRDINLAQRLDPHLWHENPVNLPLDTWWICSFARS